MKKSEIIERKLAALCMMKLSLESKTHRTEWQILSRGFAEESETLTYCEDLEALGVVTAEMQDALITLAVTESSDRETDVRVYDEGLLKSLDPGDVADEIGEEFRRVRTCGTLSGRIRTLRKQRGLSVYALAKKAGIDRGTLLRYESGQIKSVSVKSLEKLAKALGVPPQVLAGWEPVTDLDTE